MSHADPQFMSLALRLAERGLWTTDPNPRVGCVLVRDGQTVGEGWHHRPGEAHAEVNAIADAGSKARGATAFVTLEPCCHQGKTGPCTSALISAGVSRVVAAMIDPNPLVGGKGFTLLEAAGIRTSHGVLQAQAEALNPGFVKRMRTGRPYVRAKLAMSLDGRTAMASGESQWITGEDARRDVQRLRARSSAILTGVDSVLADDPSLNVRPEQLGLPVATVMRQPLRVIADSRARTPTSARMLSLPGETLIATSTASEGNRQSLESSGAEVMRIDAVGERVDLRALLNRLADREVNEVLLECGPTLSGAMLQDGLIDELVIYVAPRLLGNSARGLFELPGIDKLADTFELAVADTRRVGNDYRFTAHIKHA